MKRRLNEEISGDESLMEVSIQKALSRAPLGAAEVNRLMETDFGILVSEYGLGYDEANRVLYWLKNETYRLNAQSLSFGQVPDYEVRGCRPGSPGLIESRSHLKKRIRRIVKESQSRVSSNAKSHPLNNQSERHAKCWGHGAVVDPSGYTGLIQRGMDFTVGKSRSPLRMTEGQLRRAIRALIKRKLKNR